MANIYSSNSAVYSFDKSDIGRFETLVVMKRVHLERLKIVAYWTVRILKGET